MRKLAAILTAVIYLGLSNYCLTYAAVSGKSHCLPASSSQAQHHGDHDHGGDHGTSDEAPSHHDHSPNDSGPCCAKVQLTAPSGPQLLTNPILISFVFPHMLAAETSAAAERYFRRTDHDPPKAATQEVSLASRAPRAPPAIV